MKPIKVMIVDDHEMVRLGLRAALEPEEDIEVVGDFGGAQAALSEAEIKHPDVVLMDVRMPGMSGVEACRIIGERLPGTKVVMLTSYDDEEAVFASISADAAGYMLKNTPRAELLNGIRAAARGESLLDPKVATSVFARLKDLQAQKAHQEEVVFSADRGRPETRHQLGSDATLTIMFTDIVGSSAMTEQLGDWDARGVLRIHNEIVRRQAQAHGGTEIKSTGDGFMLTFPSARKGIQCAVEMQREFAEYSRVHSRSPLAVRIGLTTGEPVREEEDLLGMSVIIAARISAKAKGGEVLVSEIVHELVAGAREFTFRKVGDFELQGISGTHRLYKAVWEP